MNYVFPDNFEKISLINKTIFFLDIKEIRVLKKARLMIEYFDDFFGEASDLLKDDFLIKSILICWGYFIKNNNKKISFDFLKSKLLLNSFPWNSHLSNDKDLASEEKKYRDIASNLYLRPSELDHHIIHYLENRYINKDELITSLDNIRRSEHI